MKWSIAVLWKEAILSSYTYRKQKTEHIEVFSLKDVIFTEGTAVSSLKKKKKVNLDFLVSTTLNITPKLPYKDLLFQAHV